MSYLFALLPCLLALALCQNEIRTLADALFVKLDLDNDAHIEKPEVGDYFKTFDRNGDSRVSQQEYVTVIDAQYGDNPEWQRILHNVFGRLDFNNDNHLDVLDYDRLFSSADVNANSLVNELEFYNFFHSLTL
ncbi:unnamed protein product [Lymnaea stagnalis]|uniref:EF-hand domain-containing protein n=1 Tax=Lymnaea stagnalis TaxID=6523 RepID=A0AAV2I617_LYMST